MRGIATAIGTGAIGTIMLLAGCGGGSGTGTPTASATPSQRPLPTLGTPTAPPLTAGESALVTAVKGAGGYGGSADIIGIGHDICKVRRDGGSEAAVISFARKGNIRGSSGMTARRFVRTVERGLCRKYLARIPRVLLSFSGNGIGNSAPFLVLGTLTVHYTFDCSSQGTGNFIGDIETGNQASLNSDDQSFANELSGGGSKTTHVYPQEPGHDYRLD